ncbi:MAG: futalosine hydrolase [Desulfuromonadales bacterium]|nr:futalosine hydrolase [Desulfuromonadales bacterium]
MSILEKNIVVAASTLMEVRLLLKQATSFSELSLNPFTVWSASFGKLSFYIVVTGVGKANASSAITFVMERFSPELVINIGCGGAYIGSGLSVGDIAIATSEIYGDEGVLTPDGWHSMELIGIPLLKKEESYMNEFPLSPDIYDKAFNTARDKDFQVKQGKFITVSTCSGTTAKGEELFRRFGGICENMEGAAIVHTTTRYGASCLEIRGISNIVEDRDFTKWNIPLAVERSQQFLLNFLKM